MTTTTSPVERIAAPALLDRFVARVTADEPTLNDVAGLLQLLGTSDGHVEPMRLQALCVLAARALGKFDAHTRYAPPDALRDLVADSLVTCAASPENGCVEKVAPWDRPVCSDDCEAVYRRITGDYS